MIGSSEIVLPALAALAVMSLSSSHQLSTTTLAIAAAALPTIMLGKLFRPVRYYLKLTTFLLGIGEWLGDELGLHSGWGHRGADHLRTASRSLHSWSQRHAPAQASSCRLL